MIKTIYMTVADYWKEKKAELLEGHENTSYEFLIKTQVLPVIGQIRISEVTVTDLERLMRTMREKGRSVTDRQIVKAVIRKLFHLALREKLIRENPVDQLAVIPTTYRDLKSFSEEQEKTLLRVFRETTQPELFTLVMTTGISYAELARCRVCDLMEEEKRLKLNQTVPGRKRKQRGREKREIPLSEASVRILKKAIAGKGHGEGSESLIFTTATGLPLGCPEREDMNRIHREEGLERISVQDLRNHYGIRAVRMGVNPKALNRYMGFRTGFNLTRYASAGEAGEGAGRELDGRIQEYLGGEAE